MRKRILIVAGVVTVLSLIAAAFVIVPAKADDVVGNNVGRVDRPVFYNGSNPVGLVNVAVYGQQIDTDNDIDEDNLADKQRAVVVATKERFAARIAVGVKLQRLIDGEWVTSRSAGPTNSFGAPSIKVFTSPPSPFPAATAPGGCVVSGPGHRYRAVASGKVRWSNNSLESFTVVSEVWRAQSPDCTS